MGDLQTRSVTPVTDKSDPGRIQSRHRVDDVDVEVQIPAERFDDAELGSDARAPVRSGLSKLPEDMIPGMPDEVFVEACPLELHVAADIAEPPGDHLERDSLEKIVANVHHHSPELVIAQRRLRAPQVFQWPGHIPRRWK